MGAQLPPAWQHIMLAFDKCEETLPQEDGVSDTDAPPLATTFKAASIFDGSGNLAHAFHQHALPCAAYDIIRDAKFEDVLRPEGVANYIRILRQSCPGSVHWFAPPCSSWGFLSRSKSGRSVQHPEGHLNDPWVRTHNAIACFVAEAVEAAASRDIFIVLENPRASLLFAFEPMKNALAKVGARAVTLNLGDFGADSQKPITLCGTAPWLLQLQGQAALGHAQPKRRKLAVIGDDGRVTGVRSALVASATYPPAFCDAVAHLHAQRLAAIDSTGGCHSCSAK